MNDLIIALIGASALFAAQFIGNLVMVFRQGGHIKKLSEKVTTANEASSQSTVAVNTLGERLLSVFERQSQYFIEANTSLRDDRDDQKRQLGEVNTRLKELTAKVDALDETLQSTKSILKTTQDELEVTRRQLENTRVELESAKRRITDLEAQRDAERLIAANEKTALEVELQAEREKVAKLEGQVKDLQTQVRDLQSQLDAQKPSTPQPASLPEITTKLEPTAPVEVEADPTRPVAQLFGNGQSASEVTP